MVATVLLRQPDHSFVTHLLSAVDSASAQRWQSLGCLRLKLTITVSRALTAFWTTWAELSAWVPLVEDCSIPLSRCGGHLGDTSSEALSRCAPRTLWFVVRENAVYTSSKTHLHIPMFQATASCCSFCVWIFVACSRPSRKPPLMHLQPPFVVAVTELHGACAAKACLI